MIRLSSFIPVNVQEEKARFFADPTYNPQFIYSENIPVSQLTKYGLPNSENQRIAERILQQTLKKYTPAQLRLAMGKLLSELEVKETIQTFLKLHHLDQRFSIQYSASYTTRTSVTSDTLKVRLPLQYRQKSLMGMLYHEIGTHALRRINYEQQPWYKQKNAYKFSEYLSTEEGLATLHSRIPHRYKTAVTQAMHYIAISTAQHGSFSEVWHALRPYSESPDQCWAVTLRAKRGISDTSLPGGYTKDISYLDGMITVWRWLRDHNFDVSPLYFGKMALEDVDTAVSLNPDFQPQLPLFFTKNRAEYRATMIEIGEINGFA